MEKVDAAGPFLGRPTFVRFIQMAHALKHNMDNKIFIVNKKQIPQKVRNAIWVSQIIKLIINAGLTQKQMGKIIWTNDYQQFPVENLCFAMEMCN